MYASETKEEENFREACTEKEREREGGGGREEMNIHNNYVEIKKMD